MWFYVFTPGSPGYISAEVAVRELSDEQEARAWASDTWSPRWSESATTINSRAEALRVPTYWDALERWERRDDAVIQSTEVAQIRAECRAEAASEAGLGCTVAAEALSADDPEAIYAAISKHVHDGCGGRYFADEPRTRALSIVR